MCTHRLWSSADASQVVHIAKTITKSIAKTPVK